MIRSFMKMDSIRPPNHVEDSPIEVVDDLEAFQSNQSRLPHNPPVGQAVEGNVDNANWTAYG